MPTAGAEPPAGGAVPALTILSVADWRKDHGGFAKLLPDSVSTKVSAVPLPLVSDTRTLSRTVAVHGTRAVTQRRVSPLRSQMVLCSATNPAVFHTWLLLAALAPFSAGRASLRNKLSFRVAP